MTLAPIPDHLDHLYWYPGHLAWLVVLGLTPRHDPGGAKPRRADLSGADLTGADLSDAVLTGAVLCRAVLGFADLTGAVLTGAVLRDALRHPSDPNIPGWSVVDGRLVRVA